MRGLWRALTRLVSGAALILVSTYYLLASIPFTFYHFLQFPHFVWMPVFIRWHPLVALAALGALLATAGDGSAASARRVRVAAIASVTTVACMALLELAPAALSYELAAFLSFVPLGLLAWGCAIDLAARPGSIRDGSGAPNAEAVIAIAACAAIVSSGAYLLRAWFDGAALRMPAADVVVVGGLSLASHLVLFGTAGLAIAGLRWLAVTRGWSAATERIVVSAGAAALLALVIHRCVLASLMLSDARALGFAVALGIAIVACGRSVIETPVSRTRTRWGGAAAAVLVLGLCVAVLPRLLLLADWGSTLQKIVVVAAWTASIALAALLDDPRWRRRVLAVATCAVLIAIGGVAAAAVRRPAVADAAARADDLGLLIERHAAFDTSVAVLLDLVRPMVTDAQFFDELRRAGDATDDRSLTMVPLRLVERLAVPAAPRPHIFIVVVDSLRPDYLSAYNPAVTFTPAIGAFAAESIVMRQAFTPYAGTALSEPALWAGGLIPRAQYAKPFSDVNNLERLLVAGGYRQYLSVDEILSVTLSDWRNVVRLDRFVTRPGLTDDGFKFDLCATVEELSARFDRDPLDAPLFVYTQPQSVHIRVLAGDTYPKARPDQAGFFTPAVDAIRRVDGCFGRLIEELKRRHIYEDSIVVLTSDHGDSYGEGGRWGHAFYLEPETMRIPLIVRVPEAMRQGRRWDTQQLALLTDLTPTLFDLLGVTPGVGNDLAGRSFMTEASSEPLPPRDLFLLQSSYSRVFGLLDGRGRWMYKADAVRLNEELYELGSHGLELRPLDKGSRPRYRRWLLEQVRGLDRYYGKPQD